MLSVDSATIRERLKGTGIGLRDALAVLEMFSDDLGDLETQSPYEVFQSLNRLIERTVHGTKIERFRPERGRRTFHCFEVYTEGGDSLGHLNVIYLRKPIPCHYLVYVEILRSFRDRGLGSKILRAFREFAEDRKSVGLLDNIIPPGDPTYGIYAKLGWKSIKDYIGEGIINGEGNYMVYIPRSIQTPNLSSNLTKLFFNLRKKRPVIDMHDNEDMVKRAIEEFRSVYGVLLRLFDAELSSGTATPLMRFMFTKFTTKLIGFRRRIAALIGYTGGESLEQLSISKPIKELRVQAYSLWNLKGDKPRISGDEQLLANLPSRLAEEPTAFIEKLPMYRRPYLSPWLERTVNCQSADMKIRDLLEIGLDPTRLREYRHEGVDYVFERLSAHLLPSLEMKRRCLTKIALCTSGRRFRRAAVQVNPPLATFTDRGNLYIMRRRVEGIHFQEALDHLRTSKNLARINRAARIDRAIVRTVKASKDWLLANLDAGFREEIEELTYFVPWDTERNIPRVLVDVSGVSLDTIWIA